MIALLRGCLTMALLMLNLFFWGMLVLILGLPKLLMPKGELRRGWILLLARVASGWPAVNDAIFNLLLPTRWEVSGVSELDRNGKYLIVCNHRSWVDILVLFRIFHNHVEFIRFFLKQQLIWIPIAGFACWALEFPFMKRYSPEYLVAHPEKRGADLVTAKRAAKRYARIPVAMLIFLEGTRFTRDNQADQDSPYAHLLRPRVGALAHVLSTIGSQLNQMLDVTLVYPGVDIDLWRFVTGRVPRVVASVRTIEVPEEFHSDAVNEPGPARQRFKAWVEELWREKDATLECGGHAAALAAGTPAAAMPPQSPRATTLGE
jgi:Acyltransferase